MAREHIAHMGPGHRYAAVQATQSGAAASQWGDWNGHVDGRDWQD
jgi:hypothetical protein